VLKLIESSKPPCVSIYMSTSVAPAELEQNRIRLRNLLSVAEKRLIAEGLRRPEADELLKPVRALLDEVRTTPEANQGLAIFRTAGNLACWKLPRAFRDSVTVAKRCYVKPLLPVLASDGRYFVLAVSEKLVKLYSGHHEALEEVKVAGLPRDMRQALNYDQPEGLFQVRTGQPSLHSKEGAIFHGQGKGESDRAKEDLELYFREIDRAVSPYLRKHADDAPLVFCGVEFLFPIYRHVNTYPHLAEEPIAGNPERIPEATLSERARAQLAQTWDRARQEDVHRVEELVATPRVTGDLERILPACFDGAVEALFVADDVELYGRYDPATRKVDLVGDESHGDALLDLAAQQALAHRARVYVVPAATLPCGLTASALLRFAPS
jgi:hypothetical protein